MVPVRNARMKLSQGQLFWREVGQGSTLVFLHGSWREGDHWMPVVEQLNSSYHCLAPDLPGFGESEGEPHYSITLEVELLADYLEALKLRQVCLIGHSLGAWIAASFALKHPQRVTGLVLLAPEGIHTPELRGRWRKTRWLLSPLVYAGLRSLRPIARLLQIKTVDQLLQRRELLLQFPTACQILFQRRWAEIKAESLQDKLQRLNLPVLILQGSQDTSDAANLSYACARLVPQAKFVELPDAGSDLPQSQPESVAQHIREWYR